MKGNEAKRNGTKRIERRGNELKRDKGKGGETK